MPVFVDISCFSVCGTRGRLVDLFAEFVVLNCSDNFSAINSTRFTASTEFPRVWANEFSLGFSVFVVDTRSLTLTVFEFSNAFWWRNLLHALRMVSDLPGSANLSLASVGLNWPHIVWGDGRSLVTVMLPADVPWMMTCYSGMQSPAHPENSSWNEINRHQICGTKWYPCTLNQSQTRREFKPSNAYGDTFDGGGWK